ncbi:MAG: CinA family protein [Pseudomonadota bacterium]|nr:CinA family protein [Pseudomonadota bacterium]
MVLSIEKKALHLTEVFTAAQLMVSTAESCTGGGIAAAITTIPGSAAVFDSGFVTYSNDAKQRLLGVKPVTLSSFGAVSEQTAIEMAEGALANSNADISVSVTGIAGPDGGTPDKPVGTVWFAFARRGQPTRAILQHFEGDRAAVRSQAVLFALSNVLNLIQDPVK